MIKIVLIGAGTVKAALADSRDITLQALLVDPVVDSVKRAEGLLDTTLEVQTPLLEMQTPHRVYLV